MTHGDSVAHGRLGRASVVFLLSDLTLRAKRTTLFTELAAWGSLLRTARLPAGGRLLAIAIGRARRYLRNRRRGALLLAFGFRAHAAARAAMIVLRRCGYSFHGSVPAHRFRRRIADVCQRKTGSRLRSAVLGPSTWASRSRRLLGAPAGRAPFHLVCFVDRRAPTFAYGAIVRAGVADTPSRCCRPSPPAPSRGLPALIAPSATGASYVRP